MESATRAHTVSKFYLHGFVAAESEDIVNREPYVWVATVGTREMKRRSPSNVSIERGYYDGPGGFVSSNDSIERHLGEIESDAATAIKQFTASQITAGITVSPAIWRFLAWQACRTPGWFDFIKEWVYRSPFTETPEVVEPPPEGIEKIKDRMRSICMEDPDSGERHEITRPEDFDSYRNRGWKWVLSSEDRLEMLQMQAWYFQVRHFPRLNWVRLNAPDPDYFIISDRGVTWIVDGYAQVPPAALRDPSAIVVAPLTRKVALVGRHGTQPLNVTAKEINRVIAATATGWVAGPTRAVVDEAMQDRVIAYRYYGT
jgi:hypothetical protein